MPYETTHVSLLIEKSHRDNAPSITMKNECGDFKESHDTIQIDDNKYRIEIFRKNEEDMITAVRSILTCDVLLNMFFCTRPNWEFDPSLEHAIRVIDEFFHPPMYKMTFNNNKNGVDNYTCSIEKVTDRADNRLDSKLNSCTIINNKFEIVLSSCKLSYLENVGMSNINKIRAFGIDISSSCIDIIRRELIKINKNYRYD